MSTRVFLREGKQNIQDSRVLPPAAVACLGLLAKTALAPYLLSSISEQRAPPLSARNEGRKKSHGRHLSLSLYRTTSIG